MTTGSRAIAYVRVSTEEQGDSGAGLEAQRRAIRAACTTRGWDLVAVCQDIASGKSFQNRPQLQAAREAIHRGEADVLVVAKLDRLSRSVIDAAKLINEANRQGWGLVALDLGVDTTTPQGEMVAHVMASFAQFERRLIGERTRSALAVKRAMGVQLGRPVTMDERVRRRIRRHHRAGASLHSIAEKLNRDGVPTARGGVRWYASTVRRVLRAPTVARG
jgi:DNA invertase Pin-like site-specific DNA recombinase